MNHRAALAAVLFVSLISPTTRARADDAKRAVPDYDGRGDDPTTAGDVLLWVPRVVLSPLYLLSEYVVRRPLGALVTAVEENEVPALVIDIFTFDGGNAGFAPTFLFDFGLEVGARASVGVYFFWDDLITKGHKLRARAAIGGEDWLELDLTNRFAFAEDHEIYLSLDLHRRKDGLFAGIGPSFAEEAVGRYGFEVTAATIGTESEIGKRGWLITGLELRHTSFFRGTCCEHDAPTLQDQRDAGYYAIPPGFEREHLQLIPKVELALDSRHVRPASETGVRVSVDAEYGQDLAGEDASYVRGGGEVGGFVDLYEHRTLGLRLYTNLTEPTGDGALSFADLSQLGGKLPMRAFVEGQLRGRSAFVATLDYRWPIWVWLDGNLFAELGNVFGPGYDGMSLDKMRVSFGMGVRPADREDHPFELLFAFGTDTAAQGLDITNFRVVFGTTSGF